MKFSKIKKRTQRAIYLEFIDWSGQNYVTGADGSRILKEHSKNHKIISNQSGFSGWTLKEFLKNTVLNVLLHL